MEPPVRETLRSRPKIKKIKFDLLHDLPDRIGSRFGEENKIYFRESDYVNILNAIGQQMKAASEDQEEPTVYDVHVVGIMPTELGSRIAANMRLWDDVVSLSYATPRRAETLIFDTKPAGVKSY